MAHIFLCIPNAMPGNMDVFEIAPKLQTLEFGGMHAEADTPFPKENLSFFSDARPVLGHDTVRKYLDIITSTPGLTMFFYFHYDSTIPESPSKHHPQIVHQSLRTLSTVLGPLIDSLMPPGLLRLTVKSCMRFGNAFNCPEDTLSHIYNLVVHSECSLAALSFVGAVMDDNLLPLLQLTPWLILLSFEWYSPVPSEESDGAMKSVFLDMSKSNSRVLEMPWINVCGRGFHLPFINNNDFCLEKLKSLQDDGLELCLDLDDLEDHSSLEDMYNSGSEDGE
ncbi:hypothetical protein EDD18DRAFT_1362412 [Armillaria luteobubalina]|uniref:Uncharacterized protein n=1 Tax=Armillaria luteobubalina TaxID=153913 RepID=A0AA39UKS2_9AGAR|nr:hypothetical protein EDD18DRAFT_1362412 [Armillaria luteobubalina]